MNPREEPQSSGPPRLPPDDFNLGSPSCGRGWSDGMPLVIKSRVFLACRWLLDVSAQAWGRALEAGLGAKTSEPGAGEGTRGPGDPIVHINLTGPSRRWVVIVGGLPAASPRGVGVRKAKKSAAACSGRGAFPFHLIVVVPV